MANEFKEAFWVFKAHLILLGSLFFEPEAPDWGGPYASQKRPYGNSDIPKDLAELLPNCDEAICQGFHREMGVILQILAATGEIKEGRYTNDVQYGRKEWKFDPESDLSNPPFKKVFGKFRAEFIHRENRLALRERDSEDEKKEALIKQVAADLDITDTPALVRIIENLVNYRESRKPQHLKDISTIALNHLDERNGREFSSRGNK